MFLSQCNGQLDHSFPEYIVVIPSVPINGSSACPEPQNNPTKTNHSFNQHTKHTSISCKRPILPAIKPVRTRWEWQWEMAMIPLALDQLISNVGDPWLSEGIQPRFTSSPHSALSLTGLSEAEWCVDNLWNFMHLKDPLGSFEKSRGIYPVLGFQFWSNSASLGPTTMIRITLNEQMQKKNNRSWMQENSSFPELSTTLGIPDRPTS
jgi:hypothetical protein